MVVPNGAHTFDPCPVVHAVWVAPPSRMHANGRATCWGRRSLRRRCHPRDGGPAQDGRRNRPVCTRDGHAHVARHQHGSADRCRAHVNGCGAHPHAGHWPGSVRHQGGAPRPASHAFVPHVVHFGNNLRECCPPPGDAGRPDHRRPPPGRRPPARPQPVFVSNVSADAAWGMPDELNPDCGWPCAYNATSRTKFWGLAGGPPPR